MQNSHSKPNLPKAFLRRSDNKNSLFLGDPVMKIMFSFLYFCMSARQDFKSWLVQKIIPKIMKSLALLLEKFSRLLSEVIRFSFI